MDRAQSRRGNEGASTVPPCATGPIGQLRFVVSELRDITEHARGIKRRRATRLLGRDDADQREQTDQR